MNTTLTAALDSAAAIIVSQNEGMSVDSAKALARQVMEAAGVDFSAPAPAPAKPAAPPAVPRIDAAALANASPAERYTAWREHEKNLANWLDAKQSYIEPISDEAQAAKARLLEMRAQSEAETDLEKVRRAMEKERLHSIILANGMARL